MGRTRARRTIQGELSYKGIKDIISQLHSYQSGLKDATNRFVQRLAEEGYDIATIQIQEATKTADKDKPIGQLDIISDSTGWVSSMTLQFTGEQVLFVEFGSGFYNNTSVEVASWADQFGYGVGTFPRQTHANDESGWSYYGNDDTWHHTMGTEGTAPMYYASKTMKDQVIRIATEVFGSVI